MKKLIIVAAVLMSIAILASCGTAAPDQAALGNRSYEESNEYDKSAGEAMAPEAPAEAPAPAADSGIVDSNITGGIEGVDPGDSILQPGVDRKIIYNGSIVANTKEFDKDCDMILSTLQEFGGYVESSYISGTKPENRDDKGREAQMALRVPNNRFDSFISILKGVGLNKSSQVSGQDISLQYYDREAQLDVLRVRQQKSLELFEKAADSTAQIEFFNEYTSVSDQIQRLETDLRTYDSLIDFSTINITLYEVLDIKEITPAEEDLGSRISNGFYSALNGLVDFGEWLIVFVVSTWPILIILGLIIFLIIYFVKRSNKKGGANKPNKLPPYPPYTQGGQGNDKQG
jgi:hypothetical protein